MFAPTSNVADISTFLIRDDAYARSSAVLGRTLRLGDPIDTGVVSAAYQTDWSGGTGQTSYSDTSMYLDGNLDTTDPTGRIRFHPSFNPVSRGNTERTVAILSSPQTNDYSANRVLFGNDNGQVLAYRVASPYGITTMANFTGQSVSAMCHLEQTGGAANEWFAVGFTDGTFKIVQSTSGTIQDRSHPTVGKRGYIHSVVPYKRKIATVMNSTLFTCDFNGTSVVWSEVVNFSQGNNGKAYLAVLNEVLYALVEYNGGRCALWASDGTTGATLLHTFENSYPVNLLANKGGLYIHVNEFGFDTTTVGYRNSALYSFSGGSMRKLYSRTDDSKYFIDEQSLGPSCVYGDYIAISYVSSSKAVDEKLLSGTYRGDQRVGVILYDPVNDSFHPGPFLAGCPDSTSITALGASNGSLYMALSDGTKRVVCETRRDRRVTKGDWATGLSTIDTGVVAASQFGRIVSSSFDAGFPDQNKTWLRINVKHNLSMSVKGSYPFGADTTPTMNVSIRIYGTEYKIQDQTLMGTHVGTFGNGEWEISTFDLKQPWFGYPQSTQLRYVIDLYYSDSTGALVDIDSAVIDSVSVEYMLVATPKKVWRARVLCEDNQLKLNNTANALDTRQELVDKLFLYWQSGQPLYYWDASSSTVTPSSTNYDHIVMITDIGENSYRIDSNGEEVNSEVSLTMYEVA
jgi:hypothetical protein